MKRLDWNHEKLLNNWIISLDIGFKTQSLGQNI
jgi:hypothetical protein